ncbi:MAG: hypothetical protein ACD_4C00015G0003 [uncultured bacterium (gcode 4)]|uniref:Uncharacterized protein n=1 Tax=uncultured bacterium (gcode 4) TaxID=1234023 RepID=K2FW50_9BACT|nr:MAG: hypothetical protein ACD_4C00015G0003 [uncultured bacterium (gcode 4)]
MEINEYLLKLFIHRINSSATIWHKFFDYNEISDNELKDLLKKISKEDITNFLDLILVYIKTCNLNKEDELNVIIRSIYSLPNWVEINKTEVVKQKYITISADLIKNYQNYSWLSNKLISMMMDIEILKYEHSFDKIDELAKKLENNNLK